MSKDTKSMPETAVADTKNEPEDVKQMTPEEVREATLEAAREDTRDYLVMILRSLKNTSQEDPILVKCIADLLQHNKESLKSIRLLVSREDFTDHRLEKSILDQLADYKYATGFLLDDEKKCIAELQRIKGLIKENDLKENIDQCIALLSKPNGEEGEVNFQCTEVLITLSEMFPNDIESFIDIHHSILECYGLYDTNDVEVVDD